MTAPDEDEARARLDETIRGAAPSLTSAEVALGAGVTLAEARRLWRALGFPTPGDETVFTEADLHALQQVLSAAGEGGLDFDTVVSMTRAVGTTMARLADWEVATLARFVEKVEQGPAATGSRVFSALQVAEAMVAPFEELLIYSWRRHLNAAVERLQALGDADADLHSVTVTVGFADLVNFTALSNDLDQGEIGELVEIFESRCGDVIAARHGRVIKTLGDSVLFVTDAPEHAMEIASGIIEVIGNDHRLPDVRIGMATGPVVTRLGDVFGPAVNMAARLTPVARRNRVIVDRATADLLPENRYECQSLPPRPVRGFGVIEPVAVRVH
jgi:adenylate cyclase